MNLPFGYQLVRKAAVGPMTPADMGLASTSRGGWFRLVGSIREAFSGAWQRNVELAPESVLTFGAVYACVTLVASDIAKVCIKLVEKDDDGIWSEVERNSPFWPVLRKPNHFQTRIKFFESWLVSKLINGNAYILKQRDNRRVVTRMYVLDPSRVKVLVAPDGQVFYGLAADNLSGIAENVTVPASEIIHDVMVALYHPLCGVSPLTACGLAAWQGLKVQQHSANLFENGVNPGGLLVAPGVITQPQAKELQELWEQNYGGQNTGRIAVIGNGLKFERMSMTSVDAQLIEQLKWTAENVCTAYHVPPYMIGVAPAPPHNNIEALQQQYYAQCLQTLIESIELLLDEGLGLVDQPVELGTEFDLDELLRMDTTSRVKAASESMNGGGMTANEVRKKYHGLGPVDGGDAVLAQQQNFSLAALAKRDAKPDPFAKDTPTTPQSPQQQPAAESDNAKRFEGIFEKAMAA